MAPELFVPDKTIKKVKGRQSDIWAAGITLFNLLTKRYPFVGKNLFDLADKVRGSPPDLSLLASRDPSLINLLERMLEKDMDRRIMIYELIEHDWVTEGGNNPIDLDCLNSTSDDGNSSLSLLLHQPKAVIPKK